MLFVSDEVTAVSVFAAARANHSALGEVSAGGVFLYPLVAAGKSVESINAIVLAEVGIPSSNGLSKCRLMHRSLLRSRRARNS